MVSGANQFFSMCLARRAHKGLDTVAYTCIGGLPSKPAYIYSYNYRERGKKAPLVWPLVCQLYSYNMYAHSPITNKINTVCERSGTRFVEVNLQNWRLQQGVRPTPSPKPPLGTRPDIDTKQDGINVFFIHIALCYRHNFYMHKCNTAYI